MTKHTPEQIITKLRAAEVELAAGLTIGQVCKKLAISEQTFHRWRQQYGGMKADDAKRLKELEAENERLKRVVRPVHRAGGALAERLRRVVQRQGGGRTGQGRGIRQRAGGPRPGCGVEEGLQRGPAAQCAGLPDASGVCVVMSLDRLRCAAPVRGHDRI